MELNNIYKHFRLCDKIYKTEQIFSGNINCSYKLITNGKYNYFLQRINKNVFKNPRAIMHNSRLVIDNLTRKGVFEKNLKILKTKQGMDYHIDTNGNFWRCYYFLENTCSFNAIDNCNLIYETGSAFGKFQAAFCKFDLTQLYITIENFHNTKKRFDDLFESAKIAGERLNNARSEFDFLNSIKNRIGIYCDLNDLDLIPTRITHNDTKCNNVLFDTVTNKALCVIDLDTVMPGLVAYDFGDGARSIASNVDEENRNFSEIYFDLTKFKYFTDGFLCECKSYLTKIELDTIYLSVFIITAELAARFLTDYFIRDKYFKIDYPTHNLNRAKNQIALLKDIDKKLLQIKEIVKNSCNE